METLVLVVHVLLAITVIALVLLQHGRGADAGAAFGSGASGTVFGARGATSFLQRLTTSVAALFFVTSLGLAYMAAQRPEVSGIAEQVRALEEQKQDAAPPVVPNQEPAPGGQAQDVPRVD